MSDNAGITVLNILNLGWCNLIDGLHELGLEQIENGITALNNGMKPDDVVQQSLDSPLKLKPDECE